MAYELKPRKRMIPRIPSHWFKLRHGMTLHFWLEVKRRVVMKSIRQKDYVNINKIIEEILRDDFKKYYVRYPRGTHTETSEL